MTASPERPAWSGEGVAPEVRTRGAARFRPSAMVSWRGSSGRAKPAIPPVLRVESTHAARRGRLSTTGKWLEGLEVSADLTMWSSEAWSSAADVQLLARSREGSAEAFGELWRRHLPAAYAVAGRNRGRSAPEDVVAEAAARVLAMIRAGKGPDEHFRAYFLSAVRSVAIDQGRSDLRVVPTDADDLEDLADTADDPFEGLATD